MKIAALEKYRRRNRKGYFEDLPRETRFVAYWWLKRFLDRWERDMPPWRFASQPSLRALRRCKDADPERMGICELEKAAVENQSVEKWIETDRKLDPNWTEEKSKALYQCKEEWLKDCTERLNEARANLSAEEGDIWSLLGT